MYIERRPYFFNFNQPTQFNTEKISNIEWNNGVNCTRYLICYYVNIRLYDLGFLWRLKFDCFVYIGIQRNTWYNLDVQARMYIQ